MFTTEYKNPVNNTPEDFRNNMREALEALRRGRLDDPGGAVEEDRTAGRSGASCAASACLRRPSPHAAQRQGREDEGRIPDQRHQFERIMLPYVQNLEAGHQGERPKRRQCAVQAARGQPRLRHHRRQLRPVEIPRQRAARFLGLGRRRRDRQPQHRRHQEPRRRQADRQDRLLEGSRRARRRNARPRSRAAVELLRRPAVVLSVRAARLLGHFRPPGETAVADLGAHSGLVVRCRQAEGARRRKGK